MARDGAFQLGTDCVGWVFLIGDMYAIFGECK